MKKYLYFDATPNYYAELTAGMSDKMKKGLANALAHHMMPLIINDHGVWMTREDYLKDTKGNPKWSLLDNEGKWHYYHEFKE